MGKNLKHELYHLSRSWLLLLAHMKATLYCLDEDPEIYKEEKE